MRGLNHELNEHVTKMYHEHVRFTGDIIDCKARLEQIESERRRLHTAYLAGEPLTTAERMKQMDTVERDYFYDVLKWSDFDNTMNMYDAFDFRDEYLPGMVGQAVLDAANDGVIISINEEDFHAAV